MTVSVGFEIFVHPHLCWFRMLNICYDYHCKMGTANQYGWILMNLVLQQPSTEKKKRSLGAILGTLFLEKLNEECTLLRLRFLVSLFFAALLWQQAC